MEPVRYVERLNARYRSQGFPPYQWTVNDTTPFTPLAKDLAACRVSLLTSGGLSQTCAAAWDPDARNDFRLDEIPPDAPADGFQVHDSYYDTASADDDVNCIFPIDRLRELAAEGVVGSVAPRLWSGFMGRIYKRSHVVEVAAPAFAEALAGDDVDLVVLAPA
jgi:D-proline reductase (dithiol) PrdB